jgi:hypothetical protein
VQHQDSSEPPSHSVGSSYRSHADKAHHVGSLALTTCNTTSPTHSSVDDNRSKEANRVRSSQWSSKSANKKCAFLASCCCSRRGRSDELELFNPEVPALLERLHFPPAVLAKACTAQQVDGGGASQNVDSSKQLVDAHSVCLQTQAICLASSCHPHQDERAPSIPETALVFMDRLYASLKGPRK